MSSAETDLKTQLESYESELQTVASCLACTPADDPNYKDLQELKQQLEEVITLTKDQYLEIQKQKLYEELGLNSTTGAADENQATSSTSHAHVDNTEDDISKQIEGKQCSVPYRTQSGKVEYHNAVAMCIERNEVDSECETINVRVFFCNPVMEKMKPCAYFMRGECKFTEKDCKYSHGYVCPLTSLGEPIELVVNDIKRDYRCLARTPASDLWREAVVEQTLDDHRYLVQVSREEQPLILELENIAPICEDSDDSSDSDSDSESEDPYVNSHQWETIDFEASPIGAWETHTRGIASKLMKKMGYVWGQGLGKTSQGLVEPIQPIFYPERKSLDACIAIRKKTSVTAEKKKAKLEKAVAKQIANGYHKVKPENVFDFLNDKICKLKKPKAAPDDPSKSDQKLAASYKVTTDQKLNVEAFKISEDLKKAESELFYLQAGMFRANSKATKAGFKSKLDEKRKLVDSLRRKEKLVESEQKSRNSHRKLTTF